VSFAEPVTAIDCTDAPAKINLTLRVLGRRSDGYHDIESLVVFARVADRLTFARGEALDLHVYGPTAACVGDIVDNLVLKAARALADRASGLQLGSFVLTKRLPVAAGLGGGSADAAAALRLLARANGIASDDPCLLAAARATGADVPVCLDPRPRVMRGIGEVLSAPLDLPPLAAVLVNPGVAVATKEVFARLDRTAAEQGAAPSIDLSAVPRAGDALVDFLAVQTNDLERPARELQPATSDVLKALRGLPGCQLARMSGSGATCFALFKSSNAASAGAKQLHSAHPHWWIEATMFGAG
jgi:4-diphosphocytidyl-2-C-methyl-D-erythritol kinase